MATIEVPFEIGQRVWFIGLRWDDEVCPVCGRDGLKMRYEAMAGTVAVLYVDAEHSDIRIADDLIYIQSDVFATEAEAQAEAGKRNAEGANHGGL